jgi:hypothetical protein
MWGRACGAGGARVPSVRRAYPLGSERRILDHVTALGTTTHQHRFVHLAHSCVITLVLPLLLLLLLVSSYFIILSSMIDHRISLSSKRLALHCTNKQHMHIPNHQLTHRLTSLTTACIDYSLATQGCFILLKVLALINLICFFYLSSFSSHAMYLSYFHILPI